MLIYTNLTDNEIVDLLKSGDRVALDEIYKRYHGILYSHAYRRLPDREEVRDMLQELFRYLWESRSKLQFTTGLSAYLYASIRNRIINHYRNKKVRDNFASSLQEFLDQGEHVIEEQLAEKELAKLIEEEVAALPEQMRLIFGMSRTENLTHNEIAEILNLSPHTVRNQVHNALKVLRVKLGINCLLMLL